MSECKCGKAKENSELKEILEKYEKDKSNLIQILNQVQEKYGYISQDAQKEISEYLDISMAEVYGVITFYSRFTLEPKGKYNIAVCLGTACFVKGSEKVLDKVKEILKIDVGQTTEDGLFSMFLQLMMRFMEKLLLRWLRVLLRELEMRRQNNEIIRRN